MDRAIQFPGLTNAWTMPIKTRIDMLSTGIKTPVGIKIAGPDLAELERIGRRWRPSVKPLAGHAFGLRRAGDGRQLPRLRDRPGSGVARYGLTVGDVRGRHPVRHRRDERGLDRRRSRTLPDQRALSARAARRSRGAARDARAHAGRRADSARPARDDPHPPGSAHDQVGERAPQRLGLRRSAGHRRRDLGRAGQEGRGREGRASGRLHASSGRASTSTCSTPRPGCGSSSRSRCS